MRPLIFVLVLLCLSANLFSQIDAPKAARSVHLHFSGPDSVLFYNEVTVEESHPGSYFAACGFKNGYFGIQELGENRGKVVIFSIWDPGEQNNPTSVATDKRVELLGKGEGVRTGRFGGEGTGGQSFFTYPWKLHETYRLLIKAKANGTKTAFSAYFYLNQEKRWQHIATFQTLTGGDLLKGYYSFIEDFRRDGKSATEIRKARFGNGWLRTEGGEWVALTKAKFTADRTTLTLNIDAGTEGGGFYLATGGETKDSTPLNSTITRLPVEVGLPD